VANAIVCAACGTRFRDNRVQCPRCGASPVAAGDVGADVPRSRTTPVLVAAGVVLCVVAALVAGRSSGAAAAAVSPAAAVTSESAAPQPDSAARSVMAVTPEAGVAAIDASRVALAAYSRGDMAGSLEQFTEAVDANPGDASALNNLAQVLVRTGRAGEAIPYFDRAIAIAGGTWAYHFNRARAHGELKSWPQAVAGYREAARLFPEDYATQFNLGKALQANGDLPDAVEAFERTIALAPGQADFHLSHGLALEGAQRPRDAAAAYRRFLDLMPSSPEAEKIKGRISQLEGL
jgi:tetratricopeptide (TPR) repeat protein